MDCIKAQEQILEAIDECEITPDLKDHLTDCKTCHEFFEIQTRLDRQLTASIAPPALSSTFRASLAKKIRRMPLYVWPEFLPDAAHLAGCVCATIFCLTILPFPAVTIMLAGGAFTLVTYFFQTAIRGSLETLEDGQY